MIFYSEKKHGRKSKFYKIITDKHDKEVSRREVEIPLVIQEKDNKTWFLLYDDDMNVLRDPTTYLNFDMKDKSLNTRRHAANALRLLYVFISLSNYNIRKIQLKELNELISFLQGLNSNPIEYKTHTRRCNDTVNGLLGAYREFFRTRHIYCTALFDAKICKQSFSLDGDLEECVERIQYINNLRTTNPNKFTVPPYVSPDEFNSLYSKAKKNNDLEAMCIMRLGYCYGLRLGEILGLTIEDIKEVRRDNNLVPILVLRNRLSDKPFQYAKNLGHIQKKEFYRSKEYTKMKSEIVIDYSLYELLCDYIVKTHTPFAENVPNKYALSSADIVSYRDRIDENHYVFLSSRGTPLQGQTWGKHLKKYFQQCNIYIDKDCRENGLSHRFRHGFAMLHAHFRKDPVNALRLKNMMRHASLSSTMKYYNPTQEEEFKLKTEFVNDIFEMIPSLKKGSDLYEH